uniref:Nucleotidyltransferase domain-containing protein n=1 Tax=Dictyoglomus thermophilum TaxID=14 RepID=A0A7C3RKL6_DICTH
MDKLQELIKICKKYNIALCYLFGSQKDNALKILKNEEVKIKDPLADIDVGIVFDKNIDDIPERYKLYANIYNEMEDIFKPYKLDLVFLQECHSVFQFEAIKGICVYSISDDFKENYEMMILRRSADFKYVLDKFYEEAFEKYKVKK